MKRLTALAQIDYSTGYGIDACQKLLGLINRGWNIYVRPTKFEDKREAPVPYAIQERLVYHPTDSEWELQITPPWMEPTKGKKTVLCTTLEATGTVKEAISVMSRVQAIIVPCGWNQYAIRDMGIKTPVHVCPESIDPVFKYRKPDFGLPLTFGAAGNVQANGLTRKNIMAVREAFQRAFPQSADDPLDKVRLRFKTDCVINSLETDTRIDWHTSPMEPQGLADWYGSLDVFVSASRGEAWGRMIHEAMGVGRPIIACLFAGHRELLSDKWSFFVAYEQVPCSGEYAEIGEWCEPSIDSLREQMLHAYDKRKELPDMGKRASEFAQRISDSAAEQLECILLEIGALKREPVIAPPRFMGTSDEDRILGFYEDQDEVPKIPVPYEFRFKNLTNTPTGIGDTMLLTPFANTRHVWSTADSFPTLMYFNSQYSDWIPRDLICADKLQKRYAMGPGHLIQRLHRVFGLEPPLKPKGNLEVKGIDRVKNRVAIHLLPGGHADWQKRYIHPRAREIYDETAKGLQQFVRTHGGYQFFEIGSKRSTWINEAQDKTGIGLFETIRFMATCEIYLGIISGPMHIAAALDLKSIVILNFPDANRIFLPTLKDIPQIEADWFLPQACHLHQESDGPLVKRFSVDNLERAFNHEIYPYFDDRFLPLIHEKL